MQIFLIATLIAAVLSGCDLRTDINAKPTFGNETGLPKNCRAIIAASVKSWRQNEYSAESVLESIDRNCGANGHSWGEY